MQWVIDTLREQDRWIEMTSAASANNGLQLDGSIDSLSRQVNELLSRTQHATSVPSFTVTATTSNTFPSSTKTFSLPAPQGGGRIATINITGKLDRVEGSTSIFIWIELSQGSRVILQSGQGSYQLPGGAGAFGSGPQRVDLTTQVLVPDASAATFSIKLIGTVYVEGTTTAEFSNIRATISYGARI